MTTKYTLCSRALILIGANPISSFSDGSSEADVAGQLYDSVKQDLLSRYPWRFASGQVQLARLTATPSDKWDAAYQLPTDCETIVAVRVGDYPIKFDRYEDKLFCNATTTDQVFLDYAAQNDESRWPGYFQTLMVYELAAQFAVPVGDRDDLSTSYDKKSLRHFGLAKNIDARGRTVRRLPVGRFRAARLARGDN